MSKETETPFAKINLRLDKHLLRRVEALAKDAERSANGEIVYRLRRSLEHLPDDASSS
jgi:hypothetical protein